MNCPKCGKETKTTHQICPRCDYLPGGTATVGYTVSHLGELDALLARAEKAEAAVQEWREWGDKAAKRNWNEGTPALALVLDERPDSTAGSDLLERLRKAEAWATSYDHAQARLYELAGQYDALRAENERLREVEDKSLCWDSLVEENESIMEDNSLLRAELRRMRSGDLRHTDFPRIFCPSHGKRLPCGECKTPAFDPAARPIWEIAAEIGAKVPPEVWAKAFPDKVAPRRSLWPLAIAWTAAVALWTFIALRHGWFSSAWAWVVEVMG